MPNVCAIASAVLVHRPHSAEALTGNDTADADGETEDDEEDEVLLE